MLQMAKQMEMFKVNLEEFAAKHKDDIRKDPEFRVSFQEMCASIGVDPLACKSVCHHGHKLYVSIGVNPLVCKSVCLFVTDYYVCLQRLTPSWLASHSSVHLSVYPSIHHPSVGCLCPFIHLSVHLSVCCYSLCNVQLWAHGPMITVIGPVTKGFLIQILMLVIDQILNPHCLRLLG